MTTILDIQGRVAVQTEANVDIERLRWLLEPSDKDVVHVSEGVLEVTIVDPAVPFGYLLTVRDALNTFCTRHARVGSVFCFNAGVLVVGPSVDTRRAAYLEHLQEKLVLIKKELQRVLHEEWKDVPL